jgi:hypothetical protein
MALPGKNKPLTEEQKIAKDFLKNLENGQADIGVVPLKYRDHILMLCSPEQLELIEKESLERVDTERFWQKHCETRFGINEPTEDTWRESYFHEVNVTKEKAFRMKKQMNDLGVRQKKEKDSKATRLVDPLSINSFSRSSTAPRAASLPSSVFNKKPISGGIKKTTTTRSTTGNSRSGTSRGGGGFGSSRGGMPALMKQSITRLQNRSSAMPNNNEKKPSIMH